MSHGIGALTRREFGSVLGATGLAATNARAAAAPQGKRAFRSLMMGSVWATEGEKLEHFCDEAQKFGATSCIVNILPDPFSLHVIEQPDNGYMWNTMWGPSMDQYVSSDLTYGLYPEAYLKRNRQVLRRVIDAVKAHGMTPWMHCGEPRFFPERFYRVYPHLRGPRVDNPNYSVVPLYAPCTDYPEIHDHYREMMGTLIREFPELGGMIVYSGDSGTGFCHSPSLYPGPNGPRFCKDDPSGEKIRRLVTTLLEAARKVDPEFRVDLGLYIWGKEREPTLARGPQGVGSWVNGYWVAGSLEDVWANMQYPGGKVDEVGYDRARAERLDLMVKQIEEVKRYKRPYFIPTTAPMESYLSDLQMAPNPYQALGMLAMLRGKGEELYLAGAVTDSKVVPFDINKRVTQMYLADPDPPADQIVRQAAVEWVGERHADALCKAWRLSDEACRKRPLPFLKWGFESALEPLVPDPARLSKEEQAQKPRESKFTAGSQKRFEASSTITPGLEEKYRVWMLDRFRRVVLPQLAEAEKMLWAEVRRAEDPQARVCLDAQARHIGVFHWYERTQYNFFEASRHLTPTEGTVQYERTLAEIIDDEIAGTVRLLELIQPRPAQYLSADSTTRLKARVEIMRHHRNDPPKRSD